MKARVISYLNIRTGLPEILPNNNPGYYQPNDIVNISQKVIGDAYKGNNIWYKLEDGSYIWSGGINKFESLNFNTEWWLKNSLFSVPDLWDNITNNQVTVAVLDTGISKHIDFNYSKIKGFNYITNTEDFIEDKNGHGTHCAGIIASQGNTCFGIAPDSNLFIAKVCDDYGIPNVIALKNALNDIYLDNNNANDISIINMSFGLIIRNAEENKIKNEIIALLKKISKEKNCLIISSCGSVNDHKDSFPSLLAECVSVGCLNSNLQRHIFSRKTETLDVLAPGEEVLSLNGISGTSRKTGTSQAAAFISGVCALILQKINNNNINKEIVKKAMYATAFSNSFPVIEYGYGIINPNKMFENLRNL